MAKRKIPYKISQLRTRGEFDNGFFQTQKFSDLKTILQSINILKNHEFDEFYRYLPIASVACIESFYRSAIKLLIDKGGLYFDNLEHLISITGQKVDFEILSSLQKAQFTIGEFVSHILPCNNINDLNGNLSIILGADFFKLVKNHRPITFGEYDDESFSNFNTNYDTIISGLVRTFELRHIFCHESANEVIINRETVVSDFYNCELFLNNASNFICSLIYENWGLTTHDKVELLKQVLETKQNEVDKRIKEIRKNRTSNILEDEAFELESRKQVQKDFQRRFDNTINYWRKYIDAKAHLKSKYSLSSIWSEYIYLDDKLKSIQEFLIEIY